LIAKIFDFFENNFLAIFSCFKKVSFAPICASHKRAEYNWRHRHNYAASSGEKLKKFFVINKKRIFNSTTELFAEKLFSHKKSSHAQKLAKH